MNLGLILLVFYCLLYGLRNVLVRLFLIDISPLTLTFYVYFFILIYSFIIHKLKHQKLKILLVKGSVRNQIFILSIVTAVAFGAEIFSIYYITPIFYTLIDSSFFPVFVAIFSSLILKEKFSKSILLSLLICLVGLWIFYANDITEDNFKLSAIGIILALISSISFAITIPYVKKLIQEISFEEILFYRFLLSIILLLPIVFYTGSYKINLIPFLQIGALSLFGYLVTLYISLSSLKQIPANIFGLVFLSVPIFSFIFSILILKSDIYFSNILGAVVVIFGLLFTLYKQTTFSEKV